MYALLVVAYIAWYIFKRIHLVAKALKDNDRRLPRLITTIQPMSALAAILPRSPFHRELGFPWFEKSTMYRDANLKTLVVVPVLLGRDIVYTSNLQVFRQCLSVNSNYKKPPLGILDVMGENVVTADGDVWKRHRRITAPAFNHTTYRNVWDTTTNVYADMSKEEGWIYTDETAPENFNKITHKLALFLISIVGFSVPMSWYATARDNNGRLSIQAAMFQVASSLLERAEIPRWCYRLGVRKLNDIEEAFTTLECFMRERISERDEQLQKFRTMEVSDDVSIEEGSKDVFGRIVNARAADGKLNLSDDEIIGNCFIFSFAGHETTANGLAMALALLAVNQDKQEWVYESIKSAIGDRAPVFEDFDSLYGVLACFYEAMRMFPPAYLMAREAARDQALSIPRRDDPEILEQVLVKKGTIFCLDVIGLSYDPQTYPEPESFKPERWVKKTEKSEPSITRDTEAGEISGVDGFFGFSFGPRTCLGHKFAKVEAVCFLTLLLRDWRVVPHLLPGETKETWGRRVLNPKPKISLHVEDVILKLVRRK